MRELQPFHSTSVDVHPGADVYRAKTKRHRSCTAERTYPDQTMTRPEYVAWMNQ